MSDVIETTSLAREPVEPTKGITRAKTKEEQRERDQEFFEHYLTCGNATEAAKRLGLKNPAVAGCHYKKRVLSRIEQHTHKTLTNSVPMAMGTLLKLVQESSNDRVKLDAAKTVLEFSGFKPPEKSIVITKNMSPADIDKELKTMLEGVVIDSTD